jgi:hypothetical protein
MKRLLLTISIIFSVLINTEGRHRHIFSQISIKEGLTSTVNCICKEKDGEVWIGTPNGLYSFNGYTLKHYDIPLFKGSKVYQTSFDAQDNLWVLTNKCLAVKYANSDTFTQLSVPDNYKNKPFYNLIFGDDCVWIGAVGRIYKYSYADSGISLFCNVPEGFDFAMAWRQIGNFLRAIAGEEKLLVDGREARNTMELITAIYKSACFGRSVRLPLPTNDVFYRKGGIAAVMPHFHEKTKSVDNVTVSTPITLGRDVGG